jgi:hypothetical protein
MGAAALGHFVVLAFRRIKQPWQRRHLWAWFRR